MVCQLAGEALARISDVPLPGPVLGLMLLLGGLALRRGLTGQGPGPALTGTAQGLLSHLGLLFVPAGVGVVTQLGVLQDNWLPVLASILVSTAVGLAVTGWVMQRLTGADAE